MQSLTSQYQKLHLLPKLAMKPQALRIISQPHAFKQAFIQLIEQAQQRIYVTALYIEQDAAGTDILKALFAAKQKNPALDIQVFVDFHRAQRGRIGARDGRTNQQFYAQLAQQYAHKIGLFGVAIKNREMLGVLHLKGFVVDDTVLYSGASLNNVYVGQENRYRLDRYHQIQNPVLADAFVGWIRQYFLDSPAVHDFTQNHIPTVKSFRRHIKQAAARLKKSFYAFKSQDAQEDEISITPLVGLGMRGNRLNKVITELLGCAQQSVCIYTPYFNLPRVFATRIKRLLKKGVQVTILVGDKTANDFYIPPDEPFSMAGGLPYLYEYYLRDFLKKNQRYLDQGTLQLFIWKHENNSFHLKGISIDERYHLLTGSNLNPRAQALDIENGILVHDPKGYTLSQFHMEKENIFKHAYPIKNYHELQTMAEYPEPVQRILKRVFRLKANVFLRRIL